MGDMSRHCRRTSPQIRTGRMIMPDNHHFRASLQLFFHALLVDSYVEPLKNHCADIRGRVQFSQVMTGRSS